MRKNAALTIKKKASVKLNIIIQMPEKMGAALTQFFTDVMKMRMQSFRERFEHFSKKKLLFLRFFFKGGLRNKCRNAFPLNTALWDPRVTFCSYIPNVKFYKVSFGG